MTRYERVPVENWVAQQEQAHRMLVEELIAIQWAELANGAPPRRVIRLDSAGGSGITYDFNRQLVGGFIPLECFAP